MNGLCCTPPVLSSVAFLSVLTVALKGAAVCAASAPPLPAEQRTYRFNLVDVTYREVLADFVAQSGMGIEGCRPTSRVTFDTGREVMTFALAANRLCILLFNHPDQHWFWRPNDAENYKVARVTQTLHSIRLDHVFSTTEQLADSGLPGHDIILVLITLDNSPDRLPNLARYLPGYVRCQAFAGENAYTILATKQDAHQYLSLCRMMDDAASDGAFRLIEHHFQNIEPATAIDALRKLYGSVQHYNGSPPRRLGRPAEGAPPIRAWTDWAHRRIIVAAPEAESDWIAAALTQLDPPEDRTYRFNMTSATYADILDAFVRQSGLRLEGCIPNGSGDFDTGEEAASLSVTLGRLCMVFRGGGSVSGICGLASLPASEPNIVNTNTLCRGERLRNLFLSWEAFADCGGAEHEIVRVCQPLRSEQRRKGVVLNRILPSYVRGEYFNTVQFPNGALMLHGTAHDVWHYLPLGALLDDVGAARPTEFVLLFEHVDPAEALTTLRRHYGYVRHYRGRFVDVAGRQPAVAPLRFWSNAAHRRAVVGCAAEQVDAVVGLVGGAAVLRD